MKAYPIIEDNDSDPFQYGLVLESNGTYSAFLLFATTWLGDKTKSLRIKGLETLNGELTGLMCLYDGGKTYFPFAPKITNGVFTIDITANGQAKQSMTLFCIGSQIVSA